MADKDLDLDELHQAVNALMQKPASAKKSQKSTPAPKPAPAVESSSGGQRIEVKRTLPKLATQRPRGRTMDVVAPKPVVKLAPPSVRVKRQAAALQPVPPAATLQQTKLTEVNSPKSTPESPDQSSEPPENVLSSLDMQTDSADALQQPQPKPTSPQDESTFAKPIAAPSLDEHLTDDIKAEEAKAEESPFVNTKVEKRPLGAYASPVETPIVQEEKANKGENEQEFRAEPLKLPDEDESNTDNLRQMSIPQQYADNAKKSNVDERPVFDIKDYHPPIQTSQPPHRSAALSWTLIIVFALVLTIALCFAYFVVTGGFDLSILFG